MKSTTTRRFRTSVAPAFLGSVALALVTLVCFRLQAEVAMVALLYLFVVIVVSLGGDLAASVWVSVLAAALLAYFFMSPLFHLAVTKPLDIVALLSFLTTALVINRLIVRMRRSFGEVDIAREQLRLVIDTVPVLLASLRPDGALEFVNQQWRDFLGLSLEDARGASWAGALHPEDEGRFLGEWRDALASGVPLESEARMRRADGEYRWLLIRLVPLRDRHGHVLQWYGTSIDIEDRKRAEDGLRKQALLLDLTHDTIFVRDMNDVITFWNRGAQLLYGWNWEEAIGKASHQLMQTIFPAPLDEINEQVLRTGQWEGELVHTKREGTQVVVSSRWSLQRDASGKPVAILETNNDITERKRAEDALRRSESYLAEAERMSHTGSWAQRIRSPEEGYRSRETSRIHGLDADDSRSGSTQDILDRIHPDDLARVLETSQRATEEKTDYEVDYRALLPDGSIRYLHAVGHPVLSPSGEVVELVGTVMDVTDRKRAERALRRARERRFAAVLEERTRLARDIHDTLLQGFTGIALKLVAATNRVTGPMESVVALRDLIGLAQETLIDARRAVWDLRSPALAAGDFSAALRTAAEDCVRGTKLELEYDAGGPPRPVNPDVEAVVVRVVQEAITNVIKHADARTVRVRLSFGARRVRLSVTDDGRGFAVASDFHAYGGHWGLLGMRERASQVRGKLLLRSTPGHGTDVVLLVPYAARHEPPAPAPVSSRTPPARG